MSRTSDLNDRVTALYRYYEADTLLYVGISHDAFRRATQHTERSAWYTRADRMTIERLPTRADARTAELDAIRTERPLFNIEGTDRDTRRFTTTANRADPAVDFCHICEAPINPNQDRFLIWAEIWCSTCFHDPGFHGAVYPECHFDDGHTQHSMFDHPYRKGDRTTTAERYWRLLARVRGAA